MNLDLEEEAMMKQTDPETVVRKYFSAFGIISPAEREAALRSSVADGISFSNPGVDGHGIDDLLTHIARFQERFPGGRFRINWLRQQHGQALAQWTQLSASGSELITAYSYAKLDKDGRILQFAGFWENFPETV